MILSRRRVGDGTSGRTMGGRLLLGSSAAALLRPFLAGARPFIAGARPRSRSLRRGRDFSACSGLQPPDIPRLAEAARISLTPEEVEEFAPKINQVIDWFGQLQGVDLESVEPALRADTELGDSSRPDTPETFDNREAILAAVPSYDDPYIKVPKVLNKE